MRSFIPLVFSTLRGGIGHTAAVFYRRLAFLDSLQKELSYSSVTDVIDLALAEAPAH